MHCFCFPLCRPSPPSIDWFSSCQVLGVKVHLFLHYAYGGYMHRGMDCYSQRFWVVYIQCQRWIYFVTCHIFFSFSHRQGRIYVCFVLPHFSALNWALSKPRVRLFDTEAPNITSPDGCINWGLNTCPLEGLWLINVPQTKDTLAAQRRITCFAFVQIPLPPLPRVCF